MTDCLQAYEGHTAVGWNNVAYSAISREAAQFASLLRPKRLNNAHPAFATLSCVFLSKSLASWR